MLTPPWKDPSLNKPHFSSFVFQRDFVGGKQGLTPPLFGISTLPCLGSHHSPVWDLTAPLFGISPLPCFRFHLSPVWGLTPPLFGISSLPCLGSHPAPVWGLTPPLCGVSRWLSRSQAPCVSPVSLSTSSSPTSHASPLPLSNP